MGNNNCVCGIPNSPMTFSKLWVDTVYANNIFLNKTALSAEIGTSGLSATCNTLSGCFGGITTSTSNLTITGNFNDGFILSASSNDEVGIADCGEVAACFGGITSSTSNLTVTGDFSSGFVLSASGTGSGGVADCGEVAACFGGISGINLTVTGDFSSGFTLSASNNDEVGIADCGEVAACFGGITGVNIDVTGDFGSGFLLSALADSDTSISAGNYSPDGNGVVSLILQDKANTPTGETVDISLSSLDTTLDCSDVSACFGGITSSTANLTVTGDFSSGFVLSAATAGDALTSNTLAQFAATTSAQLAGVITDETGTGVFSRNINPTFQALTMTGDIDTGLNDINRVGNLTVRESDDGGNAVFLQGGSSSGVVSIYSDGNIVTRFPGANNSYINNDFPLIFGATTTTQNGPQIVFETTTSGTGNFHGTVDHQSHTGTGSVNSFDSRLSYSGNESTAHIAPFQSRALVLGGGRVGRLEGYQVLNNVAGQADVSRGLSVRDPSNSGTIFENTGIFIESLDRGLSSNSMIVIGGVYSDDVGEDTDHTLITIRTTDDLSARPTFNWDDSGDKFDFSRDVSVPEETYGVGWDGSTEVATKNDIYDKIEAKTDVFIINVPPADESTALTTGTDKYTFVAPFDLTLVDISAFVTVAPTGDDLVFDVNLDGTTVMTTDKVTIDAGTDDSKDAATQPALTTTAVTARQEIAIDIDQIGSGTAGAGAKIYIEYNH